ncbi:MAG: imidazole glycerol phosphate synthase subunit HisH [Clostridiales bacterium]|nr:imidazole glycerol phosphate synthase subunit HisH [Clostridiales bacterium]
MIAIVDYGAGNLKSVKNALDFLGEDNKITAEPKEILGADKVILPGVGAFGGAMEALCQRGLDEVVKEIAQRGTPLLGICLGLQLMFEESEESPGVKGLGLFKGKIVKIPDRGLKIPHMGWNSIDIAKDSRILRNLGSEPYVYFVHSYYLKTPREEIISAYTEYGERLGIAAERGNVFATQFHPEKSGAVGMEILRNFIGLEQH